MGHSVHPTGFRLSHAKNWDTLSPISPLWGPTVESQVELPLLRWLSGFDLLPNSFSTTVAPFGSVRIKVLVYSPASLRLQQFLFRKGRRITLHPLLSRTAPYLPPSLQPETISRLNRLPVRRRKHRFGILWSATSPTRRWFQLLSKFLPPLLLKETPPLLSIHSVRPTQLSGQLLSNLLSRRLRTGAPLPKFANRFLSTLFDRFSKSILLGLFVGARGRFTRSQMATTTSFRRGSTPFSSISATLSSGAVAIPLKYGVCTLSFTIFFKSSHVFLPPPPKQLRRPAYPRKNPRSRL